VHRAPRDAGGGEGDYEEGDSGGAAAAGADCGRDVVGEDGVGDPFLGAGDDVVRPCCVLCGDGFDARDVRAGFEIMSITTSFLYFQL
jgi:hypothetical protein